MSTNDDLAGPVPLNENQELIGESEGAEMAASAELEQPAPEERSVIHRDSAQTVSAEQVEIHQGGAQTVKAQQVEIRQGGAQYVEADKVSLEQSGALCMRAEQATITASTVGILASEFGRDDPGQARRLPKSNHQRSASRRGLWERGDSGGHSRGPAPGPGPGGRSGLATIASVSYFG